MKIHEWSGPAKAMTARIFCPVCRKSKVIEGYDNAFWWKEKLDKGFSTNCDHCRALIRYIVRKNGVETFEFDDGKKAR